MKPQFIRPDRMSIHPPIQTQVDLLRHGEPVGGRRYRGQIDDPLSEQGWQQMRAAVLGRRDWDVIYSSPLKRCAEFAQELSGRLLLPFTIDERLKEIGFGDWEGRTPDEIRRNDPLRLENFWRNPIGNRPEGAETLASFQKRVSAAWAEIGATHAGQRVLIIGHAGITRMILSLVLGSPAEHMFRIQVDNAGLTRIRIQGSGLDALPMLVFHGRLPAAG
jgi:alpha-ribazole phosphatase/probable phosphoglycerate mutase